MRPQVVLIVTFFVIAAAGWALLNSVDWSINTKICSKRRIDLENNMKELSLIGEPPASCNALKRRSQLLSSFRFCQIRADEKNSRAELAFLTQVINERCK